MAPIGLGVAADEVALAGLLPSMQYCMIVPAHVLALVARGQVQFPVGIRFHSDIVAIPQKVFG